MDLGDRKSVMRREAAASVCAVCGLGSWGLIKKHELDSLIILKLLIVVGSYNGATI